MPKILSYTPPWLSRPAPGSRIFTDPPLASSPQSPSKRVSQNDQNAAQSPENYVGPRRQVAARGTEIFIAVGNKLRWADLAMTKHAWEERAEPGKTVTSRAEIDASSVAPYRELAVSIFQQIRQLIISPSEKFMAIVTKHTVHIAVLPDPVRLRASDQSPLKLKIFQLGPTTHVIPESPVVCALWHPLAVATGSTDCLVTITAEAAVRVWELDRSNHWSFDRPSLAIDLKKLIDGTSCDQDFEPSGFGKSRGFSVDAFDMEVSSGCFGGSGFEGEDGWASMTLWVCMRNGDVYALCPLLPSRWQPTATTVPLLTTDIVSKISVADTDELDPDERRALQQQFEWVKDIDNEEPISPDGASDLLSFGEIRRRPLSPSAIPRLQGPFDFDLGEDAEDTEISDIYVLAAKADLEELISDEDQFAQVADLVQKDLSATLICLASNTGRIHVLLDTESVSGQWLPKSSSGTFMVPSTDSRELCLVGSLVTEIGDPENEWPIFSSDVISHYGVYVTSAQRITYLSFEDWAARVESEISAPTLDAAGLALRLQAACEGSVALQESVLAKTAQISDIETPFSAPALILRNELGFMLLTFASGRPFAAFFDDPETPSELIEPSEQQQNALSPARPDLEVVLKSNLEEIEPLPRDPYVPHSIFYEQATSPMKRFLAMNVPQRQKVTLKQQVRLSPATLDITSAAHRTLSSQTNQIEAVASDLFRRCERLREELSNQVKQMSELSNRIQAIDNRDDGTDLKMDFDERLEEAKKRQRRLFDRHEALRRKMTRANIGRKMSPNEVRWAHEIRDLAVRSGLEVEEADGDGNLVSAGTLKERFEMVKQLADQLLPEAKSAVKDASDQDSTSSTAASADGAPTRSSRLAGGLLVPSKLHKAKIAEAMEMVERESAVIEAATVKLERLNLEY